MAEALTLKHLMTHVPKTPGARHTCQRAKPQRKPCKRNAHVGPVPTAFGEQVTADHIITLDDEARGDEDERHALVVRDRATKWTQCFPVTQKTAEQTLAALRDFRGNGPAVQMVLHGQLS